MGDKGTSPRVGYWLCFGFAVLSIYVHAGWGGLNPWLVGMIVCDVLLRLETQGIAARSDKTRSGLAEGKSPVGAADAPKKSTISASKGVGG